MAKKKNKLPTSNIQRSTSKTKKRKCRVCGCTDDKACEGGCYWVEPDLCSRCSELTALYLAINLLENSVFCDSQGEPKLFKNKTNPKYHLKIYEAGYNNTLNTLEKLLSEKQGFKRYKIRVNHE